ncbi:MAG: hypothetical protein C4293_19060 [Nitrospiraceae bacterium]
MPEKLGSTFWKQTGEAFDWLNEFLYQGEQVTQAAIAYCGARILLHTQVYPVGYMPHPDGGGLVRVGSREGSHCYGVPFCRTSSSATLFFNFKSGTLFSQGDIAWGSLVQLETQAIASHQRLASA